MVHRTHREISTWFLFISIKSNCSYSLFCTKYTARQRIVARFQFELITSRDSAFTCIYTSFASPLHIRLFSITWHLISKCNQNFRCCTDLNPMQYSQSSPKRRFQRPIKLHELKGATTVVEGIHIYTTKERKKKQYISIKESGCFTLSIIHSSSAAGGASVCIPNFTLRIYVFGGTVRAAMKSRIRIHKQND